MSAQDNLKIVQSTYDAFNKHSVDKGWLDKASSAIAEHFEGVNVASGQTFRGPQGFKQNLQTWATAFSDSSVQIISSFATENRVCVEFIGRGTHTGPLVGPSGTIPATGRKGETQFCDVYEVKDGKITGLHTYFDTLTMLTQLGVVPPQK